MNKTDARPDEKSAFATLLFHLASVIISAAALIYLGYHFLNSFSTEITTEYALQVTENDAMTLDAYIFRNETVLYSNVTGTVGTLVTDGTKVKGGNSLANIYGGIATGTDDSIVSLDKQIDLLSQSEATEGLTSSDTYVLDSRISEYYYTIRQNAELGVYSNLQKRRDELLTLLNKRKIITGAVTSYADIIERLEGERDMLTAKLDAVSETVTAPHSGYFYSKLDGYEAAFNTGVLANLTFDSFDTLIASSPRVYPSNAVGKLATDFEWYAVAEATRDSLRYFTKGYNYTVVFPYNGDESFSLELSDIITGVGDDRVLLIFRSERIPEDFSFKRMQQIDVVRSSYTGYKVPISAARLVDGVQGVYILVGNLVEFRAIDVLLELDGYYIVAPQDVENDPDYKGKLGLYDAVITGGKDLFVGKMID